MTGVTSTTTTLTGRDKREHILIRLGHRRMFHRVKPGLYSVGNPSPESPVLVTANFTLSFDALRTSLGGVDAYILVLDTKGVNVWCAAGKGTFGTDEVVRRVEASGLKDVVTHRKLVLPQLGAPGVAAHEVKKRTGFAVHYGPVRASDVREYLRLGKATDEMRRVRFPPKDRAVLIPVEMKNYMWPSLAIAVASLLLGGWLALTAVVVAFLTGTTLFPLLLPHLPTKHFTSKGMTLGLLVSLPFAVLVSYLGGFSGSLGTLSALAGVIVLMPPVVGYMGLNWTGCSTYSSRTGVKKEIFRFVPVIVVLMVAGLILLAISGIGQLAGWF